VDVGGLCTFSKKERGMEIIFQQIWKYIEDGAGFRTFVRMTPITFNQRELMP
jgi:hypothetical protein